MVLSALLGGALVAAPGASAGAVVLDFEDLYPGHNNADAAIPAGYAGFNWTNAYWSTKYDGEVSGFTNAIDGNVGAYTGFGNELSMGGKTFTLRSAIVAAGWNDNQYVTFSGYRGGTLVASERFLAPFTGELHLFVGFDAIDSLVVTPDQSTGTPHTGSASAHHIVLDNIDVVPYVPVGTVIDFEDLYPGHNNADAAIPAGYAGFNWTNAYWSTKYDGEVSGFTNAIDGNVGAYTGFGNELSMGGKTFTLRSAIVAAGWNDNQYVTFSGYRGGAVVASERFLAPFVGELHLFAGFDAIDSLVVTPDQSTGTPHTGSASAHHIVLDNIEVLLPPNSPTTLVADDVSGNVGQTVQLSATLTDDIGPLAGKSIDFAVGSWTGSGTTAADGVATADYTIAAAGDQTYSASFAGDGTYLGSSDDATLTGNLNPTGLVAADVSGNVGQTVQLSATLTDGTDPLAGETVDFTIGTWNASATTDASGVAAVSYTIPAMGDKAIEASYAGTAYWAPSMDEAALSVYNSVTGIGLFLSANPVTAGQAATATVVDQAGNTITDKCVLQIQHGAGGSWAGSVYTSEKAGSWTVTASYGPLGDTAVLQVTPGAVAAVDISPDEATITAAGAQSYTVRASDGCGNVWVPAPAEITWTHDGAGGFAGNTYTADAADAGKTLDIHATVAGVQSDRSALTVTAAGGAGLVLAWDRDTCAFYLCANPADPQTGAPIPGVNGGYVVNGVAVLVSGSTGNRTVAVQSTSGPSNTLQVRWYVRGGVVSNAYMYSTIDGVGRTASYGSGRTLVDGSYKMGFFGLTHALDAVDPATITYGAVQQP